MMKKFVFFRSQRIIVLIYVIGLCIAVFAAVQFGFQHSEEMIVNKMAELVSMSLSKDEQAFSNLLYDVQKLSAITSTSKEITSQLSEVENVSNPKTFLDYSLKDLRRIESVESMLTTYRNTFFSYSSQFVIKGIDGSIYSVLDGVSNSYQFSSSLFKTLSTQKWYQDFMVSDAISTWQAPVYYTKNGGSAQEKTNETAHVLFCRKIRDYYTQRILGIAVVSLPVSDLSAIWQNDGSMMGLVNAQGQAVYSADNSFEQLCTSCVKNGLNEHTAQSDTGYYVQKIDGVDYVVTYTKTRLDGWRLLSIIPQKIITEQVVDARRYAYTISFVVVIISAIICTLMLLWATIPLNKLMHRMGEIRIDNQKVGAPQARVTNVKEAEEQFNRMALRIEEMTATALERQAIEEKMRYEMLRAQLNPHFLFNTLNTIKWSAMVSGAGNIVHMIASLGELLEGSMRRGEEYIPLIKEIDMVKAYIEIKNWTLKYPIVLQVSVPPELERYPVFKFCLQTAVENAAVHGFVDNDHPLLLISVWRDEKDIVLQVSDNGCGMSKERITQVEQSIRDALESEKGVSGVGLSSVNGMIRLAYGEPYGIHITSKEGTGTAVEITLPYREETSDVKGADC